MTEHAAGIFVFFFLGEYASIILICILITIILLGGHDIITIIYFLEKILYTFLFIFFTLIYSIYLNLTYFIIIVFNISEDIVNNKIYNTSILLDSNNSYQLNGFTHNITKLNLFYKLNNINETLQINDYIVILINNYSNFIEFNLEHVIYELREKLYFYKNFNIMAEILKNISDNKILLSLIYALGIAIKTIILIFLFI
jgi:hypothetical protein